MPRGGWLREVRRWACCGLRRTGGPSPGFGAFSSSPYTVPLCWVWGPGIAVLWSCQRIDVCDSVRLLYLLTYLLAPHTEHAPLACAPLTNSSPAVLPAILASACAGSVGWNALETTSRLHVERVPGDKEDLL